MAFVVEDGTDSCVFEGVKSCRKVSGGWNDFKELKNETLPRSIDVRHHSIDDLIPLFGPDHQAFAKF